MTYSRARRPRAVVAVLAPLLVIGLLAGCGGQASARGVAEVRAAKLRGLGNVLVDGAGYTLYVFIPDHRGPSRCTATLCTRQWPPLLLPKDKRRCTAGPGIRGGLLGTYRRSNGRLQVTYNSWPLYTYANDASPGQATGQAEDMGNWYVLSPSGTVDYNQAPGGS